MNVTNPGWSKMQRQQGNDFLEWLQAESILNHKFCVLARALRTMLYGEVGDTQRALEVCQAIPAVLERCNEQETYCLPGAASAYAWLHLLDRYVRTWQALEILVRQACAPMGRFGINALDVGTGPGPAAFAIHDFYAAMVDFSERVSKKVGIGVEVSRRDKGVGHNVGV